VSRAERVVLGNRTAYLEAVLAAARLAAIATPLNARLTAPELNELLADATPRVLIHEAADAARIEAACRDLPFPPSVRIACGGGASDYERRLAQAAPRHAIEPVSPDDPMLLMYTSGTTGTPKGALLPHRKTLYNSRNAEGFFSLTSADRVLVILPLFHSFGLKILALPALHAGASVFLHAPDPRALAHRRSRADQLLRRRADAAARCARRSKRPARSASISARCAPSSAPAPRCRWISSSLSSDTAWCCNRASARRRPRSFAASMPATPCARPAASGDP
jgi:acyl-CoA synthetase (AMP-forming)/AMP-acid ligase II